MLAVNLVLKFCHLINELFFVIRTLKRLLLNGIFYVKLRILKRKKCWFFNSFNGSENNGMYRDATLESYACYLQSEYILSERVQRETVPKTLGTQ